MHLQTQRHIIISAVVLYFLTTCTSSSLPEDYVTDNEEQLARLKRENFLDSILKYLPFYRTSNNPKADAGSTSVEDKNVDDLPKEPIKNNTPLLSTIASSSSFASSYKTKSILLSSPINSSVNSTTVGKTANHTESPQNQSFTATTKNTAHANKSSSTKPIASTTSILATVRNSLTLVLSSSLVFEDNRNRSSNKTDTASLASFPVSSMVFSTAVLPAPSIPSPHSTSSVKDTAPLTSIPLRTAFSSNTLKTPIFRSTKMLFSRVSSSSLDLHAGTKSVAPQADLKKMPTLPDEGQFNDKGYQPTVIENEKQVSFVYLNILLPIVSGISGALLITFSIMLFRCCRRRKLKKVRYFGGKPSSDFVRLDRMNLLTDTSDEDEFD